jgi:hypothetical protein
MPNIRDEKYSIHHDFIITTVQGVRSYVHDVSTAAQSLHNFIIRERELPLESAHSLFLLQYINRKLNTANDANFQMEAMATDFEDLIQYARQDSQSFYDKIRGSIE